MVAATALSFDLPADIETRSPEDRAAFASELRRLADARSRLARPVDR